jgi:hypothetical protein
VKKPKAPKLPHQKGKKQKPQSEGKSPKTKAWHPPSESLLYPEVNRVEQMFLGGV